MTDKPPTDRLDELRTEYANTGMVTSDGAVWLISQVAVLREQVQQQRTAGPAADRAAVLREAADHLARQADELWAPGRTAHAVMHADADELRRLAAEAQQPEEEAELVCVDECGNCDACGMEPFGTPAEGWREAARFLRRTPRDSADFPGALRGARLIEDELRRRAEEAPQPDPDPQPVSDEFVQQLATVKVREDDGAEAQQPDTEPGTCGHRSSDGHACTEPTGHLGYHRNTRQDGTEWTAWAGDGPWGEETECCGAEPPDGWPGDCWCELPVGHEGEHRCETCSNRHGARGWTDAPAVPVGSPAADTETPEPVVEPHCDGFPTTCPNPVIVPPARPYHDGGIRCGCYDEETRP